MKNFDSNRLRIGLLILSAAFGSGVAIVDFNLLFMMGFFYRSTRPTPYQMLALLSHFFLGVTILVASIYILRREEKNT